MMKAIGSIMLSRLFGDHSAHMRIVRRTGNRFRSISFIPLMAYNKHLPSDAMMPTRVRA